MRPRGRPHLHRGIVEINSRSATRSTDPQMTTPSARDAEPSGWFDALTEDLRLLRIRAGDVSYAEIATRIASIRESRGKSPAAARVARSSVFDAFQPGRRRMNPDLVAEIVVALGQDEAVAQAWRQRCIDARLAEVDASPRPSGSGEAAVRTGLVIALLAACVGLNLFGGAVSVKLELPLFLDMIGTAAAAIVFGPWQGVTVGLLTNALGTLTSSPETILFALVNMVGALVWGYGIRRFGAGRTHLRFLALNLVTALACTLVAVPINALLYGGVAGTASGSAATIFVAMGQGVVLAILSANMLSSVVDKLIAGYLALLFARLVAPLHVRSGLVVELPIAFRGAGRRTRAA
jgi:energy-coupling factor transport system substrate-specific component